MTKLFYSILAISFFIVVGCNAGVKPYTVTGNIKGAEGKTLYLDFLTLTKATPIDTVTADAKGNFTMSGLIKEEGICRIRLREDLAWLLILKNGDKIQVNGDTTNVNSLTLKGNKANVEMAIIFNRMIKEQTAMMQLDQQYRMMSQNKADQMAINMTRNSLMEAVENFEKTFKKIADTTSNPIVAMYAGSFVNVEADIDFAKKIVARMQKEIPASVYTTEFAANIKQMEDKANQMKAAKEMEKKNGVGAKAQEIVGMGPDSVIYKLSSLKGKVVLIDFWASWCRPCRAENPSVVAAYNKYRSKGFEVFSVSLDKAYAPWVAAIQQDGLIWKYHVSDLKGWQSQLSAPYGVNSIPAQFLIDANGVIVARDIRGEQLELKLKELLGE